MSDQLDPPWVKYPEIQRDDIGWRMGHGESYLLDWWDWWEDLDTNERFEYFRRYLPLPMDWLDWTAMQFGYDPDADGLNFDGVRWLEKQGLANFAEFQKWYDENWNDSSEPPLAASD